MMFGIAFIAREIDRIETMNRQIIPRSGHLVTIVASFEDEDAVQLSDGITTRYVYKRKLNLAVCRAAEARTVTPSRKTPVLVQTEEAGAYMVETASMKNDRN